MIFGVCWHTVIFIAPIPPGRTRRLDRIYSRYGIPTRPPGQTGCRVPGACYFYAKLRFVDASRARGRNDLRILERHGLADRFVGGTRRELLCIAEVQRPPRALVRPTSAVEQVHRDACNLYRRIVHR